MWKFGAILAGALAIAAFLFSRVRAKSRMEHEQHMLADAIDEGLDELDEE